MQLAPHVLALLSIVSVTCADASAQEVAAQGASQEPVFYGGEKQGDQVRVPVDVFYAHPAFLANRDVSVEGTVGDLFAAGQTIRVRGVVNGNAFVACQNLTVDGVITGDLFFAGESARIEGRVEGDLYGFFNEVRILEGGSVGGDLHVAGEAIWIEGALGGRLVGGAQRIDVLGEIGEDVLVAAERLEVHDSARIGGDVRYDTPDEPSIDEGALIEGTVERVDYEREVKVEAKEETSLVDALLWRLWLFASTFIVGALYLYLGGAASSRPAEALAASPGKGLGIGFVVAILVPVASGVAVIACLTMPLGMIGLVAYAVAVYLARIVTAQCVGAWLLGRMGAVSSPPLAGLALGLVVFYLVTSIPWVGGLIWCAWVASGLGAVALALPRKKSGTREG